MTLSFARQVAALSASITSGWKVLDGNALGTPCPTPTPTPTPIPRPTADDSTHDGRFEDGASIHAASAGMNPGKAIVIVLASLAAALAIGAAAFHYREQAAAHAAALLRLGEGHYIELPMVTDDESSAESSGRLPSGLLVRAHELAGPQTTSLRAAGEAASEVAGDRKGGLASETGSGDITPGFGSGGGESGPDGGGGVSADSASSSTQQPTRRREGGLVLKR